MYDQNKVIYKYPLSRGPSQRTVNLPNGAEVLSIGFQNGYDMMLWAMVNPANEMVERNIRVLMTGEDFDLSEFNTYDFIGTATNAGGFVFHVFVEGY